MYEYTIDEKTYKGSCKILKVAKIEEPKGWEDQPNLILDNGQKLSTGLLYDLYRDKYNNKYFESDLRFKFRVYTLVKIPNVKEIFKRIKKLQLKFYQKI